MEHDWDKIIIVSPQNPLSACELTAATSRL